MKAFCLLLLLAAALSSPSAGAQGLRGSYLTAVDERMSFITLFRFTGNQFFYQFDGCFGSEIGEGTFVVQDGQLRLAFRQAAADTVRHSWPLPGVPANSSTIRVLVTDWKGAPLSGVMVSSKLLPYMQCKTDAAGVASLSYSPLSFDELLVKSSGRYPPVTIPLRNAGGRGYRVQLELPFLFFCKPGDKLTFQLQSATPEMLVMRPVLGPTNSNDACLYKHYQSVTAEEVGKHMRHL